MTNAQQVVHVFLKDVRGHRSELASLLVMNLAWVLTSIETWQAAVQGGNGLGETISVMIFVLMAVAWVILICRVVHGETPASQTQFWLTRPYSRLSLLLAKGAFIVVFVHLQTLFAHLLILVISGVPFRLRDLILYQLMIFAALSLPAATIAALTRTLVQFVLAIVPVTTIGLAAMYVGGTFTRQEYNYFGSIRFTDLYFGLASFNDVTQGEIWLRAVVGFPLLALVAATALVWQYRHRMTVAVATAAAIVTFCLTILVLQTSGSVDSWAQTRLIGAPTVTPVVEFRQDAVGTSYWRPRNIENYQPDANVVAVPIRISGWDYENTGILNTSVTLTMPTGEKHTFGGSVTSARFDVEAGAYPVNRWFMFEVPQDLYPVAAATAIHARFAFDMMELDRTPADPIPLDGSAAIIDGREQCGRGQFDNILCRTALRGLAGWDIGYTSTLIRPAASIPFAISPISKVDRRFGTRLNPDRAGESLATIVRRPSSYVRVSLEIENLRLTDWNMDAVLENLNPESSP